MIVQISQETLTLALKSRLNGAKFFNQEKNQQIELDEREVKNLIITLDYLVKDYEFQKVVSRFHREG